MDKLIFFTKAPNLKNCKTRLNSFLTDQERYNLMVKLIKENFNKALATRKDIIIYYDGDIKDISFIDGKKKAQEGDDLGYRMNNAIFDQIEDQNKVVLIGTDLENLTSQDIKEAFDKLDVYDLVISPTIDGGFGLIGQKAKTDFLTGIEYSTSTVLEEILLRAKNLVKVIIYCQQ